MLNAFQQHDRHHTMLANPYDPSRDLSPNLPTTSCRGQELMTNVFGGGAGAGGLGQCCALKSEFDDDCPDCCKVSPPTPMGDDCGGGPLTLPCKQERDPIAGLMSMGSSPLGHHQHQQQQQQNLHQRLHQHHHAVIGYGSPEPSTSPGLMSSYGAFGESPPDDMQMVRPKREEPAEVNLCDGCGLKILDRYYLFAVDKRWHSTCLQCSQCTRTLASEVKCFYRDGNIYCKADYQR